MIPPKYFNLFSTTNRIASFDRTNSHFEKCNDNNREAQFDHPKKMHSDNKLFVLALCINKEGFMRYSSLLAGNTAAPNLLPDMVDTLNAKTRLPNDSPASRLHYSYISCLIFSAREVLSYKLSTSQPLPLL
ncbi:MAG: hypothetical protein Q4E55_07810 [Bacteroidales bacterium]|nr:hypothetical protein [Bacteroidales bacterium]